MAAFARWTNLSETTFLLPPTDAGGRLPRAHLHARRRAALCRPPDAGQLPRLAGGRRPAATGRRGGAAMRRRPGAVRRDGGRLAFAAPPLRRSGPLDAALLQRIRAALGLDASARARRTNGWTTARGWCAVLLDSADARAGAAARLARRWSGLAKVGVVGAARGRRRVRSSSCAPSSRGRHLRRPGHRQPERQRGAVADRRAAWRRRATWRRRARRCGRAGRVHIDSEGGDGLGRRRCQRAASRRRCKL